MRYVFVWSYFAPKKKVVRKVTQKVAQKALQKVMQKVDKVC